MLIFSIVWVVLAATISVIALLRRTSPVAVREFENPSPRESGHSWIIFATVYGIILLTGFVCVGRFLFSGF